MRPKPTITSRLLPHIHLPIDEIQVMFPDVAQATVRSTVYQLRRKAGMTDLVHARGNPLSLPSNLHAALKTEAARRGYVAGNANRFACHLLTIIVSDNLFDEILDDGEERA
jgi:hypothetical protein